MSDTRSSAESVLALCESQLVSLEEETRLRFQRMANVAIMALDAAQSIAETRACSSRVAEDAESLAGAIEDMTMEFQFFDEYAQRLQHVREAISMLQDQEFERCEIEALSSKLTRLFSLHSEQRALADCLPGVVVHPTDNPGSSVELF